jgi:hypothetical protein
VNTLGWNGQSLVGLRWFGFFAAYLAIAVHGCGGTERRDSLALQPVGEPELIDAHLLPATKHSIALATSRGRTMLFWSQSTGGESTQIVGAEVGEEGLDVADAVTISDVSGHLNTEPLACGEGTTFSVVWTESLPNSVIPIGATLDLSNSEAATFAIDEFGDSARIRLNPNSIGDQSHPSVACLQDGVRAYAWSNICKGVQRLPNDVFVPFVPEECEDEPENGAYLQVLDADGNSHTEPTLLKDAGVGRTPVAAVGQDSFILLSGSSIRLLTASGAVLDQYSNPQFFFTQASLSCGSERCVAVLGGTAFIIDPRDLDSVSSVVIQEIEHPAPNTTESAVDAEVACGDICLVTWLKQRETIEDDVVSIEPLGIFARILDPVAEELGPELLLVEPRLDQQEGVLPVATGNRTFLVAQVVGTQFVLQRYQAD